MAGFPRRVDRTGECWRQPALRPPESPVRRAQADNMADAAAKRPRELAGVSGQGQLQTALGHGPLAAGLGLMP
jgi:hypothetical protein